MNWMPTEDRVIVKKIEKAGDQEERSTGLIVIEGMDKVFLRAEVISAGPKNNDVMPGDIIIHHKDFGTDLPGDGDHMILFGEDIVAVVSS